MKEIPQAEAPVLEELFGVVELPIPDAQRGRRNALRKTLMAFLCSTNGEGEEREEQWQRVYQYLFSNGVQPKEETEETTLTVVDTETATDQGTGEHAGLLATANAIIA